MLLLPLIHLNTANMWNVYQPQRHLLHEDEDDDTEASHNDEGHAREGGQGEWVETIEYDGTNEEAGGLH